MSAEQWSSGLVHRRYVQRIMQVPGGRSREHVPLPRLVDHIPVSFGDGLVDRIKAGTHLGRFSDDQVLGEIRVQCSREDFWSQSAFGGKTGQPVPGVHAGISPPARDDSQLFP